ncbi:uncharacterized protein TNCV_1157371 [Trichonephila clavipes]|nr:uncharacterized protein TNCV_1157371 [Trichonephila clavipes]
MPRLQKVFKKRKGKYYSRKNTINSKGKRILNAAKLVYEDSIQNAAEEAICENEDNKNIAVAVDGTWKKRGYTSLNGVVTVTSIDTGKVIDVDILSKYCACKNLPFHEKDCKRNYVDSSGAMEIQGASKIFQRSLSLHNARYITYLGDGDCKAFDAVKKKNIYGNGYPIEKLECIGHVMKRMRTRLRRLKAQLKGQILSDGKCLSGKNRLTEHEIDNLQSYYGSAIRRNHSSVQNMRQAIWVIFLHKLSTDEYPQHGFCPIGEDSWCGFKKAEASGKSYKHKNSLPVAVVEAMRPIFRDPSHLDLLKKCLHGKTQNPNESFHNVVWSRVPKVTFLQIETLSLDVYDAVCSFNDGNVSKLKMLQKISVEPGDFSVSAMKLLDRERLMKAIYAFSGRSKKIRKDQRRKRKKEEDNIKKNKFCATVHNAVILTSVNRTNKDGSKEEVPCPKAVAVCNNAMGRVNLFHKRKKRRYRIRSITVKGSHRIFYFLFDLAILIDGYYSRERKGRPASFQARICVAPDDMRLTSVGNHMTKMVSNYVGNVVERNKKREPTTCVSSEDYLPSAWPY